MLAKPLNRDSHQRAAAPRPVRDLTVIWPEVVSVHPRPELFGEVQPKARWLVTAIHGQPGTMGSPTAKRVEGFNPLASSNLATSAMTRGNAPPEQVSGGAFSASSGDLVSSLVSSGPIFRLVLVVRFWVFVLVRRRTGGRAQPRENRRARAF